MFNLYFNGVKSCFVKKSSTILFNANNLTSITSILADKFDAISLHTSSKRLKFAPQRPRPTTYKKPVDWLPFTWHRRPRFNLYEDSGDFIKENVVDPTLPKPDFELSDELKTANETVKNTFTLATASKKETKEVIKRNVLKRIQRHPFDFDSLEVKIALKTIQIRNLYEHHRQLYKKEFYVTRFRFPQIIQKRNKLLKQLYLIDEARLQWVLKELQLYFKPPELGVRRERYCKKWHLRQLTKQYCEKTVADKKAAYHEELKIQQQEFLEEKKRILSWIEEEEKALKSDSA